MVLQAHLYSKQTFKIRFNLENFLNAEPDSEIVKVMKNVIATIKTSQAPSFPTPSAPVKSPSVCPIYFFRLIAKTELHFPLIALISMWGGIIINF